MSSNAPTSARSTQEQWLSRYYLVRAAFSFIWVATAFTLGRQSPALAAILLVIYPLWDAAANYVDAARNGGLGRNRSQALNVVVSLATTVAVIVALQVGLSTVLTVFGGWAILSGLLQLVSALRRWKSAGAQWAMVLSGAQSALAGGFFVLQAQSAVPEVVPVVAGYAAIGAVYFLVSGLWLVIGQRRRKQA